MHKSVLNQVQSHSAHGSSNRDRLDMSAESMAGGHLEDSGPTSYGKYLDVLASAYKNLDQPDFGFVRKVFSARPYDPLIKRMRDYAVVEECTEAEDDVCFSYLLKGRNALWKLDLSVVGPYGIFVRLRNRVEAEDFIVYSRDDLTGFEVKIADLLKRGGVKLLSMEELSVAMPMTLYNTVREKVRLYQALFSDRDRLPWER
jgi:hypothetical protein